MSLRACLSLRPAVVYPVYELAGSTLVPQSNSALQSVYAGVGHTNNFVRRVSGSMEMVRALRQAEVRPRRAATIGKLRDVLISARRKKA